jgi:lysine 2,3-aminomutase
MARHPSGLDPRIVTLREENRNRIIKLIIDKLDSGEIKSKRYKFTTEKTDDEKFRTGLKWWREMNFHLKFAVRDPDFLNEMLGNSLDPDTMKILYEARDAGIPFFINPYYISLLHVRVPYFAVGADMAIRHYVLYNRQLVHEFGHIVAWEKEDEVTPGKPNAAGWILPSQHNLHRRYPDVAILIPQTMGRACGGLCSSCQRMFDFQSGNLNFNLSKLNPDESWSSKLDKLMKYFEEDSQLRDILITGGDALMSTDTQLKEILDAVLKMAKRKKEANKSRQEGKKYAEMIRVRLGTRLLAYLPQRVTSDLVKILAEFKKEAKKIGMKQFVIQTHFESPMEVTPDAKKAIELLNSAGWIITNQHVFTTAGSRRGHAAKLRDVLNSVGILPYYTFTVKGYMENYFSFAPNARSMQEQIEEKIYGEIPKDYMEEIADLPNDPENICDNVNKIIRRANLPFLATDRNVLNLPGVGKSLTFRVIGITRYGRRILEFDHDGTRRHSPIIEKMGKVYIIESKTISDYIKQLESLGEDPKEFVALYGYSIGETEGRVSIYNYPEYKFKITDEMTNLSV